MFFHDPTLYGANLPPREFPIQNPAFAPWQNFSAMPPMQNPYLGFFPQFPPQFQPQFQPQFPEMQFYNAPQAPFPAGQPSMQNLPFPVNPYFQQYGWNQAFQTPWNIPFGYQPRVPF